MKNKKRYRILNSKDKMVGQTDDIEEALKIKEEFKHEGAYIDDKKSKKSHRKAYFR
ncbi:MAG: hypothetical protein K8R49_04040 [Candidatus Cloacimonetes bacterium]|nr:hypothetical protein [Candidatus Cloacimonadota bacterium]